MLSASYQLENGSLVKVFVPVQGTGPFTMHEDEYLIRNYHKKTLRELAAYMLRTERQVEWRLGKLNVHKHKSWKTEDLSLLLDNMDNATLAMKLDRTINAIKIMKTRMGLCKKNHTPTPANCYIV